MRRLLKWGVNLAALVSAVLCAAVCVLWARGYWRIDVAVFNVGDVFCAYPTDVGPRNMELLGTTGASFEADSACGELVFSVLRFYRNSRGPILANRPGSYPVTSRAAARDAVEPGYGPHALGWILSHHEEPGFGIDGVVVPCWAACLATMPLPAWVAIRRVRRRARPGLCPWCGYDLRATPERCPECGAAPTQSA